ncbi:MAG: hypothetical protein EOP07_26920 [Proteobacteria bacterium]|nr:MAG: hypothetical protein EOP07_26920 [Pseudomonadota bacterium]
MTSNDMVMREEMAQASIPKALGMSAEDVPISLTGLNRKAPPRSLITESPYGDNYTNTRTRARNNAARPIRRQKKSLLPWLLMALSGLGVAAYFYKDQLVFDKKMHIELRTVPEVVTFKMNGVKVDEGTYKKTPLKMNLTPGAYDLEVSRPGYQKELIRFQGQAGETLKPEKIFLKRAPYVPLSQVKIVASTGKIFADVDGHLYDGETPMTVELQSGVQHTLSFHTGDNTSLYKCMFKVDRVDSSSPTVLTVTPPIGTAKARCNIKP